MSDQLITIREAVTQGIMRLRQPVWAIPDDHIEIHLVNGLIAPWAKLYSRVNERIGQKNPQEFLVVGSLDERDWMPYVE